MEHPKPRGAFSRRLGLEHCRCNGNIIQKPAVELLKPFVDPAMVCPEVDTGLGIPPKPIRLVGDQNAPRLLRPATGLEVTDKMWRFAGVVLGKLEAPDGFVLKLGLPWCGPREGRCHTIENRGSGLTKTHGMVGSAGERCHGAGAEDEACLKDYDIWQHPLTRRVRKRASGSFERHPR